MDTTEVLGRVALAALLGGLIGFDRELRGHAAGLRTNILVASAAAVFADVSIHGFAETQGYDPSRVAADVVSGIGFLGAGAIFAMGGRPRGLTTAAALWSSAAVGLSVGVGRWQVAVGAVAIVLVVLVVVDAIGDRALASRRRVVRDLYVVLPDAPAMRDIEKHLLGHGVHTRRVDLVPLGDHVGADLVVSGTERSVDLAVSTLGEVDSIVFASNEVSDGH